MDNILDICFRDKYFVLNFAYISINRGVRIRMNTCTVLSNVSAVLSIKIACCQLHNKITAYSSSDFI
jgi:hypothetical protein